MVEVGDEGGRKRMRRKKTQKEAGKRGDKVE
jgi:hypothetical protein